MDVDLAGTVEVPAADKVAGDEAEVVAGVVDDNDPEVVLVDDNGPVVAPVDDNVPVVVLVDDSDPEVVLVDDSDPVVALVDDAGPVGLVDVHPVVHMYQRIQR